MAIPIEAPSRVELGVKLNKRSTPLPAEPELLDEQILYQQGSFSRVKRYYRGWHLELGGIFTNKGLKGQETIVERDAIRPVRTFMVK